MKALYYDGTKAVYREDAKMPVQEAGHSLIEVMLANICSTDREILKGYRRRVRACGQNRSRGIERGLR